MAKCLLCNQEMEQQHTWRKHQLRYKDYYDTYIKTETDGICVVCGNPTAWDRTHYKETCSRSCAAKNPKRQEKIRNTCLKKYGVPNVYMIDSIHQKSIDSITSGNRNYKCLYCGKDTGIKKFCSDTCRELYNENNSYNNREQAKQTCIDKFNGKMNEGTWETRNTNIEQFEKEHNCTSTKKLFELYGQGWKTLNLPKIMINNQNSAISNEYIPLIEEYSKTYHNSLIQQELFEFIQSIYDKPILQNNRQLIKPQELDIVLPDLKLAIEFNGIKWHSYEDGMAKDYHIQKSLKCKEIGYRLIHIYEFEDLEKQKQLLKDLILGIDNYPINDYNKNNLNMPNDITPEIIYKKYYTIYGVGKLL